MKIRILTATDVRAALPMEKAIEAMKLAYGQFSAGDATVPLRSRVHTDKGVSLLMPAFLHRSRDFAVKVVSVYGDNPTLGLPTVAATVLVLDPETGMPLAFMEGDALTALRTGAGGGLAAEYLARKDARTVALFGAGVQARAQLQAAMAVRRIEKVLLFDPFAGAAQTLIQDVSSWPDAPDIALATTPEAAVEGADIVLAATTTKTPLFDGNRLRPGTHVTGVGSFTPEMQEIDAATVRRARVVVDARESCMAETGDIINTEAVIDAEIGEIVNGEKPGRQNDEEITFFKSVGMAAQDAVAAAAVLKAAEEKDLGTVIEMS
jgi:alanine dehydrogenase